MADIDRGCHSSTVEITEQNMKFRAVYPKKNVIRTVYQVLIPISLFENLEKYTKNIKKLSLSVELIKKTLFGWILSA